VGGKCADACYVGGHTGYQSTRHTVKSSHGHLVTRLTRHRSTCHIRVSSHGHLVTRLTRHRSTRHIRVSSQSTRHKWPQCTLHKAIRCRTDSTQKVLNTDGVITPAKQTMICRKGGAEKNRPIFKPLKTGCFFSGLKAIHAMWLPWQIKCTVKNLSQHCLTVGQLITWL